MGLETANNNSYILQSSESQTKVSIPTTVYKQKESKLIIIHRDTLYRHIDAFLKSFVEWGTTFTIIVSALSMFAAAYPLYAATMTGRDAIMFALFIAVGAIFSWLSIKALYKQYKNQGKSIDTLLTALEKECPHDTQQ